jgi:diacylglycerol kinase family enzyme
MAMSVPERRWLARLSFLLMIAGLVILTVFSGGHSLGLIISGLIALCLMVAGGYWFLANRGVLRWAALAFTIAVPVSLIVVYATRHLLWVAIVSVAALILALLTARAAMGTAERHSGAERRAERPRRPFLIMNPRSGGGKVARFGLKEKAESLGAQVAMLEGPQVVDVAALARQAVADGADLLGVAGGDGTQALVAGIASEHDLPFLCISAGTRNHFALDLGLDREDPSACLDALTDGIEQRIDLGRIGDRTFVNNASFGVYAEIVRSPAYRDDKRGTILEMLPDLLKGDGSGHRLSAHTGSVDIEGPKALLISNNPYETDDIAGLGRRERLDAGRLGLIAVSVDSAAQAISLVRRGRGSGLTVMLADQVTVDAEQPEIPVGIDGETIMMPTPVRCSIRPGALRVVVPRMRPGVPAPYHALSVSRLGRLAAGRPEFEPAVSGRASQH